MNAQIAVVIYKLVRKGMTPEQAAAKFSGGVPMDTEYALRCYNHFKDLIKI
jgi:hypothetical protein